jgi:hypothetical protein
MDGIFKSHNSDNLQKLLQNDLEYSRWATIERLARKVSTEVLLDGKYSKHTFETISERIADISTWWVISLCLFVDLIVPMAIYYLLRKDYGEIGQKRNMKPGTF